jgi:hypothetical protein
MKSQTIRLNKFRAKYEALNPKEFLKRGRKEGLQKANAVTDKRNCLRHRQRQTQGKHGPTLWPVFSRQPATVPFDDAIAD